jgi:hypothetical protein
MSLIYSQGNNTIRGIYCGQLDDLQIPSTAKVAEIEPYFVIYNPSQDSLTLEVYFDPSKSSFIDHSCQSYISMLQIGEFCLNNGGIPLSEYLPHVEVPIINLKAKGKDGLTLPFTKSTQWLDVPTHTWDGLAINHPFYMAWSEKTTANYNVQDTLYFPQSKGSSTLIPSTALTDQQYYVAYLKKQVSLALEKFQSNYDPSEYLCAINIDDIVLGGDLINSYDLPQERAFFTEEQLTQFKEVYTSINEVKTQIEDSLRITAVISGMLFGQSNRVYVKFKGHSKITEADGEMTCEVLIYPRPRRDHEMDIDGKTWFSWSFLDEDSFQDVIDYNLENGPMNIQKVKEILSANGCVFNNTMYSMVDQDTVKLSYRFQTIACQWTFEPKDTIAIRLLEMMNWEVSREFYENKEASAISISGMLNKEDHVEFKDYIKKIISDSLNGRTIIWK